MVAFFLLLVTFSQAQTNTDARLNDLEKTVKSLEDKVRRLESMATQTKPGSSTLTYSTCYIETPFNGTFSATEVTEDGARFGAMEKCSKTLNDVNFACDKRKVKCSGAKK